jgi:hypothetical protein
VTDENNSEMELYGVSPWVIGLIMIIITLITPLGMVLTDGSVIFMSSWFEGPFIYGLLWMFVWSHYSYFYGIEFFNLYFMWLIVPLSIFSILYVRQIIRHYLGKSSRDSALMVGSLSIIFPSLLAFLTTMTAIDISRIGLIIPIPIQFIVGLVFLHKFEGPEVISPWSGQFIDWSWWIRFKSKWSNRTADIIELYLEEEKEEMDIVESEQ